MNIEEESDELNDDVVEVESAKDPVLLACLESVLSEAEEMELLWKNEQRRLRRKEDEDRRRRRTVSSVEKKHSNTVKTKKASVISSDVMELLNLLKDPEKRRRTKTIRPRCDDNVENKGSDDRIRKCTAQQVRIEATHVEMSLQIEDKNEQ